jgi:hypothetical protein
MSENDTNKEELEIEEAPSEAVTKKLKLNPLSSGELIKSESDEAISGTKAPQFLAEEAAVSTAADADAEEEVDPIFAELAMPKLPELQRENRARLQMQSPNRIYFYWSIRNNPFQTLQKVFAGSTGSYQLVAKFVNLKTSTRKFARSTRKETIGLTPIRTPRIAPRSVFTRRIARISA